MVLHFFLFIYCLKALKKHVHQNKRDIFKTFVEGKIHFERLKCFHEFQLWSFSISHILTLSSVRRFKRSGLLLFSLRLRHQSHSLTEGSFWQIDRLFCLVRFHSKDVIRGCFLTLQKIISLVAAHAYRRFDWLNRTNYTRI